MTAPVPSPTIVLGLGNPGAGYADTRHNLGHRVIERLAERSGLRLCEAEPLAGRALAAEFAGPHGAVVLARTRTYMNQSGRAALALARCYGAERPDFLVLHDDADLELGRLRLRPGGGAGGHNGLRSLIDALGGEDFGRLKLGVRGAGREGAELADYVLEPFAADERPTVEALIRLAADAVDCRLAHGLAEAMNRFNGQRAGDAADAG